MSDSSAVSLDQWRALLAVVDSGGYAPAAEALGKSQSAISYAIQKLESALDLRVFSIDGRRAVLTDAGQVLYRRARQLVSEAEDLEHLARRLQQRFETEIHIAVDAIFPVWLLLEGMAELAQAFPDTRVQVYETVLTGTEEALLQRRVDLALASRVPVGFVGDPIMRAHFLPVASPSHPLHQLGRPVSFDDLRRHRQLVVRDSGSRRTDSGWLGAEQRWTLTNFPSSIRAACQGMGFAWYPQDKISAELACGDLKVLPMEQGQSRFADIFLIFADKDAAGPATLRLGEVLQRRVAEQCQLRSTESSS
ncbi:LysR family transcriptional regulator [Parahaliea maris]|uniref:LysR family transcriptional regulator n=1 Tax=Parahaliea maris TaxID=2716870 RepID=A0A5C9A681_9GAMM|nr:LysR family transcriptional regulator [Parahaliea maris]TXS95280.1 LysR family transcriptional regulator [Parahaliea maris]